MSRERAIPSHGRDKDTSRRGQAGFATTATIVLWDMSQSSQPNAPGAPAGADRSRQEPEKVSEQLEAWLKSDGEKTMASLIELFEDEETA